jgi:hypothetical protein
MISRGGNVDGPRRLPSFYKGRYDSRPGNAIQTALPTLPILMKGDQKALKNQTIIIKI